MGVSAAALVTAARLPQAHDTSVPAELTTLLNVVPLELSDTVGFQQFLLRLDHDSRRRRFGREIGDGALRAHAVRALTDSVRTFGVFHNGDLRGVIELYALSADPMLEAAVVVEPQWRRRGLAWALVQQAMRLYPGASFRLAFARDNWPMRALAAKAHARIDLVLNEVFADIDMPILERPS